MFSLSAKKGNAAQEQSGENGLISDSYSLEDYKRENERLRVENARLSLEMQGQRREVMNVAHEADEKRVQLHATLQALQAVEQRLGVVFDREGIKKATLDATDFPEDFRTQEALVKLKVTQNEIRGSQESVKECIKALKGYLKG
jgi:2-hydroxychromene-2-carboxylate isomerase